MAWGGAPMDQTHRLTTTAERGAPVDGSPPVARPETRSAFLDAAAERLSVALQPIYAISTGQPYAFEALTRGWTALGHSSPHALFDAAERFDALGELETMQIVRAIEIMAAQTRAPRPQLFVNFDTRIFGAAESLFGAVEDALRRTGLGRGDICFELSERHEKKEADSIRSRIAELRRDGYRFALDDFGNGVSDVLALYHFDIDVLKIDRFLIDGVATDARKRFFVARIVELAHLLGQRVVAEGVETMADLDVCRTLRCDLAQGFLLGRPAAEPSAEPFEMPAERGAGIDDDLGIETIVDRAPPYCVTASGRAMLDALRREKRRSVMPVVDETDAPLGVVTDASLGTFLAAPYSVDLLSNPSVTIDIAQFLEPYPIADVGVDADRLTAMIADAAADGVIVTESMRYLGMIDAAQLLSLQHARQLRRAAEQNPLSRLPGNREIARFMDTATSRTHLRRAICHFDFNHFKAFNDRFGFHRGDRMIECFARILQRQFDGSGAMLGHVGGDDFVAGALDMDETEFELRIDGVLDAFRTEALSAFTEAERAAGRFEGTDRAGAPAQFGLLDCSAAVLFLPAGAAPRDVDALGEALATTKRAAKRSPISKCVTRADHPCGTETATRAHRA